ncbi:alpha-ketoglutarate-dependent dioxygenase AlkB [bacterium]|nr:MAG: alpha-ketoglutarate-dependent dioxygenase AlkB [bacterium]
MSTPDIHLWPDFVTDSLSLFEHLKDTIAWESSMRARRTASFGAPYNYSQMSYPKCPIPAALERLLAPIGDKVGWIPNNSLVNFYPDGDSTMGFHFDALEPLEEGTGVAIVSLGEQRTLTFARRDDKGVRFEQPMPPGSLLLMPAPVQNEWLHGVLKQAGVGSRMSLTFRRLKPLS